MREPPRWPDNSGREPIVDPIPLATSATALLTFAAKGVMPTTNRAVKEMREVIPPTLPIIAARIPAPTRNCAVEIAAPDTTSG